MDSPPTPPEILSQPTRARLFDLLVELRRPAGTDELAEQVNLHPNGVRLHLERLCAAGLVERRRIRYGRGRPRDTWQIAADAEPTGEPPTSYANLGNWLVEAIIDSDVSSEQIESTGLRIGRDLVPPAKYGAGSDKLEGMLANLGFKPVSEQGSEEISFCLGNCPFRDAVRGRKPVVCDLHRGMTRGILERLEPTARLVNFEIRDPDEAGCLIEIARSGVPIGAGAGSGSQGDTDPE